MVLLKFTSLEIDVFETEGCLISSLILAMNNEQNPTKSVPFIPQPTKVQNILAVKDKGKGQLSFFVT